MSLDPDYFEFDGKSCSLIAPKQALILKTSRSQGSSQQNTIERVTVQGSYRVCSDHLSY